MKFFTWFKNVPGRLGQWFGDKKTFWAEKVWPEHKRLFKERKLFMAFGAVGGLVVSMFIFTYLGHHHALGLDKAAILLWSLPSAFVGAWRALYESVKVVKYGKDKGKITKRSDNVFTAVLDGAAVGMILSFIIAGFLSGQFYFDFHHIWKNFYTN